MRLAGVLVVAAAVFGCSTDTTDDQRRDAARSVVPNETLQVIGTSESLSRVRDLIVDGTGNVWVLNESEPFFVKFGEDGAVMAEWGRRGGGPTEFRNPVAFARGHAAEAVWVFDRARRGLFLISAGEGGMRELAFARDSLPWTPLSFDDLGIGGSRPWLARTEGGFLMAGTTLPTTAEPQPLAHWTAEIFRIDEGDASTSVAVSVPSLVGDPVAAGIPARILMPNPLWASCEDGSVAIYDPVRHELRTLGSPQGAEKRVSVPTAPAVEVTLDRIFGAIWIQQSENRNPGFRQDSATMHRSFIEESQELKDQIASHFPEFIGLQCSGGDTFWLQRFSLSTGMMGRGPEWLRVSGDGSLLEVTFPGKFRPFRFVNGRAWGIVRDELDVPHVAAVPLPS